MNIEIANAIFGYFETLYNEKTKHLGFKNSDGLLEYNEQIKYLNDDYDFLEKVRK